jgi:hypothetical protein
MATTTTNFGWDIPQSTDLVKDGATAIAALGQDIDTAFVDFKGGTTGQVLKKTSGTDLDVEWGTASSGLTLINTTSFSGVASTSSAASTFTATYDFYTIKINFTQNTTAGIPRFLFRASGSDITTNYFFGGIARGSNATTIANDGSNIGFVNCSSSTVATTAGVQNFLTLNLSKPTVAGRKFGTSQISFYEATDFYSGFYTNFGNSNATAADAFTFTTSAGTLTGSYSVYGWNK